MYIYVHQTRLVSLHSTDHLSSSYCIASTMPTTRRKRKEQELGDNESGDELEVTTRGDKLDLTFHFSLDTSANVDTSQLQAALRKTVSDFTTSEKPASTTTTTKDADESTNRGQGPCTAKGFPDTDGDHQYDSRTSQVRPTDTFPYRFPQCSREAYRLA